MGTDPIPAVIWFGVVLLLALICCIIYVLIMEYFNKKGK